MKKLKEEFMDREFDVYSEDFDDEDALDIMNHEEVAFLRGYVKGFKELN